MTIKELYEWAKKNGVENYMLKLEYHPDYDINVENDLFPDDELKVVTIII